MSKLTLGITAILLATSLCGCGKKKRSHEEMVKEQFRQLAIEQKEEQQKRDAANKAAQERKERQRQQDVDKFERAKAEREREDNEQKNQERLHARAALEALPEAFVLDPPVHLSRSLKGKTTYEFRGPRLKEVRAMVKNQNWGELAQLLDCSDRTSGSGLSEYAIRQLIRELRSQRYFFLMKTSTRLPETTVSKSGYQTSKGYHFFYVTVPHPIDADGDLANVAPFECDYSNTYYNDFGWKMHPDGDGLMQDWSPKYSDIFLFVGADDAGFRDPNVSPYDAGHFKTDPNNLQRRLESLRSKYSEAVRKLEEKVRIGDIDKNERDRQIWILRKRVKDALHILLDEH